MRRLDLGPQHPSTPVGAPDLIRSAPQRYSVGFSLPLHHLLLDADVTKDILAVTTLEATLVNCYPNIEINCLQASLNAGKGE